MKTVWPSTVQVARSAEVPNATVKGAAGDVSTATGTEAVTRAAPEIDVLVNNAGIFAGERVITEDGAEATFAVNQLGPFLLTALLTPVLLATGGGARVINVSSVAHARGRIHMSDLSLEKG